MYFSSLTGEGQRLGSGLSPDQIEQQLDTYEGPAGYEPLPVLSRSKTPTLWLFGEHDIDIPARRSAMILEKLKAQGAPFTIKLYPNADHNLQDHSTGKPLNIWPDIVGWLHDQHVLK
jgi:dienelactone hydrolase